MQSWIFSIQKGFILGDNLNNKGRGIMGGSEIREKLNLKKKKSVNPDSYKSVEIKVSFVNTKRNELNFHKCNLR